AISLRSGLAWLSTARSMRSVTVGTSTLATLTASISSSRVKGLSSRLSLASKSSRSRVSTTSGSLRVTITRGRSAITSPVRIYRGGGFPRVILQRFQQKRAFLQQNQLCQIKGHLVLEPRSFHFYQPSRTRAGAGRFGPQACCGNCTNWRQGGLKGEASHFDRGRSPGADLRFSRRAERCRGQCETGGRRLDRKVGAARAAFRQPQVRQG